MCIQPPSALVPGSDPVQQSTAQPLFCEVCFFQIKPTYWHKRNLDSQFGFFSMSRTFFSWKINVP